MEVTAVIKRSVKILIIGCFISANIYAESRIDIGLFSEQNVEGWKQKKFAGETRYSLQQINNQFVLASKSDQSASAFYKKIKVNLDETPFLNWSWSKQLTIDPGNEADKKGDDFVARLYVIKDGGLLFWKTLVVNYVWSFQHSIDESWDNPFAGSNVKMVSQRDASSLEKTWLVEKRNVQQDFMNLMGEKIDQIDGVAIMTDSDNSALKAEALYGDIYFTAE